MAQHIRDLLKKDKSDQDLKMSHDHEARFLKKLNRELPQKRKISRSFGLRIAASFIVLLSLGLAINEKLKSVPDDAPYSNKTVESGTVKSLEDVSPDLGKVEDYYLASINLELSQLEVSPENTEVFNDYIAQLKLLSQEYDNLIKELNASGPNNATLDAIIDNLRLRLNLVMRLKTKLDDFNSSEFRA